MHHLYLAPDGSWRFVRHVNRCGAGMALIRDGAVYRLVRDAQLRAARG